MPSTHARAHTRTHRVAHAAPNAHTQAYITSYGLPAIITRGNNVYGEGQYCEKLIGKFIMRAMRGACVCVCARACAFARARVRTPPPMLAGSCITY